MYFLWSFHVYSFIYLKVSIYIVYYRVLLDDWHLLLLLVYWVLLLCLVTTQV